MSDKMLQELLTRLDALAAKVGVTGEYLWGVLVKQARVEVFTNLGLIGLGLLFTGIAVLAFKALAQYDKEGNDDACVTCGIIGTAFIIAGPIATIIGGFGILTPWLNPEYWAFQELLKQLR